MEMIIIQCSNCAQKNSVDREKLSTSVCSKCWTPLSSSKKIKQDSPNKKVKAEVKEHASSETSDRFAFKKANERKSRNTKIWKGVLAVVCVTVIYFWMSDDSKKSSSSYKSSTNPRSYSTIQTSVDDTKLVPIKAPHTGLINNKNGVNYVAPLEVSIPSEKSCLIKLENTVNKKNAHYYYINKGHSLNSSAPLGEYYLKYACGEIWYGRENYFGRETKFSRSDTIFSFQQDHTGYTGYTVTLYLVSHGNMRTRQISQADF